jgi:hypothetical protein
VGGKGRATALTEREREREREREGERKRDEGKEGEREGERGRERARACASEREGAAHLCARLCLGALVPPLELGSEIAVVAPLYKHLLL